MNKLYGSLITIGVSVGLSFIAVLVFLPAMGEKQSFSGSTRATTTLTNEQVFNDTLSIMSGTDGRPVKALGFGDCNPTPLSNGSFAATSTLSLRCYAPGINEGDRVVAQFRVSLPSWSQTNWYNGIAAGESEARQEHLLVVAAVATTSDYIDLTIMNNTGGATTSWAVVGTTTPSVHFEWLRPL